MMTKRDYELIAAAIYTASLAAWETDETAGISLVTDVLCDYLSEENPLFNSNMFLAACRGE